MSVLDVSVCLSVFFYFSTKPQQHADRATPALIAGLFPLVAYRLETADMVTFTQWKPLGVVLPATHCTTQHTQAAADSVDT